MNLIDRHIKENIDLFWDRSSHALIPRNPIVIRDLHYQQRTTSFWWGFIESFGVVAIAICFSIGMLLAVMYKINPRRWWDYFDIIQLLAWTFHIVATLRMLAAGCLITVSQGYLLGSDAVILTPLSNWQLLVGKWWAAMHQVRGWMLALGIVELGIVVSTAFGHMMTFNWVMECLNPCMFTIGELAQPKWLPIRSSVILASVIGSTVLETMCCTALGMTSAILVRSKLGLIGAICLRFVPILIFSFFPNYHWASNDFMIRFTEYTWFSFADGGTGSILLLAHAIDVNYPNFERGVRALCAVISMFLGYLSLSFMVAWGVMRRSRS